MANNNNNNRQIITTTIIIIIITAGDDDCWSTNFTTGPVLLRHTRKATAQLGDIVKANTFMSSLTQPKQHYKS